MRKSVDAVILMQQNSDYKLLYPQEIDWDEFKNCRPDVPFSDSVIEFLNALSGVLLKDRQCRSLSDVITFAFFCRKANLLKLKEKFVKENEIRLGRGLLFHIAPSNVPINFGYSLVAGLLAGNTNVVRVSSKQFIQVDLIAKHIAELQKCAEYEEVASRIVLVKYDHMSTANAFFSSICNVRVIWGGDATIASLRKYELPSRSFDVCFADRYSIAVINSKAINISSDKEIDRLAEAFYNDTYLFDQNACSAPHVIFWLDNPGIENSKNRFWTAVHKYAAGKYQLQPVMAVDKLTAFYRQSVNIDLKKEEMPDNVVCRVDLKELPLNIEDYRCACGYFSENTIDSISDIAPIITVKYQTLGYYGFDRDELVDFVKSNRLQGLDRIVPIGETTSFSLIWDGYNLIDTFSRIASVL